MGDEGSTGAFPPSLQYGPMDAKLKYLAAQDDAVMQQAATNRQAARDKEAQSEPSFLQKWVTGPVGRVGTSMIDSAVSAADQMYDTEPMRKARDVAAGVMTGATNMADAAHSVVRATEQNFADSVNPKFIPGTGQPTDVYSAPSPIWDHAKSAILDFRDAVAVQDPTLSDNLIQGVSQLAVPFAGYSRALAGIHGFANAVAAGAATDATALGPHDMRMADLIALGRHTEGKLGDALRTLAPDGSAVNAYVNFLADRGDESEAEGRLKNVLDGFGANLIATPLMHGAAMVLKQGMSGLRSAVEAGVSKISDLAPSGASTVEAAASPTPVRPPLRQNYDPAESLIQEQVRRDADAAAAAPAGAKRPPLQQGGDPADPLYQEQIRRDVDNAHAAPAEDAAHTATDLPESIKSMDSAPGVKAFHSVLEANAGNPNGVPVGKLIKPLIDHLPDDEPGKFYKEILGRIGDKGLSTPVHTFDSYYDNSGAQVAARTVMGHYKPTLDGTGRVNLYPGAFKSPSDLVHTFTHEAVHAATFETINNSPFVWKALQALKQHATVELGNGETRGVDGKLIPIDAKTSYGLTNPQEFTAEMESNPEFQKHMRGIKMEDGRSVWEHYRDAMAGILGIGTAVAASPMFDKLLSATKEKKGA